MNPIAPAGYSAHINFILPRSHRPDSHARQILDVILEVLHVQILQLLRTQRGDAERHVLQTLGALLRRNDDLLETGGRRRLLGLGRVQAGDDRRRQRKAPCEQGMSQGLRPRHIGPHAAVAFSLFTSRHESSLSFTSMLPARRTHAYGRKNLMRAIAAAPSTTARSDQLPPLCCSGPARCAPPLLRRGQATWQARTHSYDQTIR